MNLLNRVRPALTLVAATALLGAASLPLAAQATGTIRGTVTEAGSRRPLTGVQVTVAGTARTAVTNSSGQYAVTNAPAGTQRIRASVLGFTAVEMSVDVGADQTATADFALSPEALSLDGLVVTGTAGAVSKRTIGNAITTVNAAEILEKTSVNTITDLLTAQAPGVTIMGNGGTVGTSGSMRIRGIGSLSSGNDPVIYLDGVRVYSGAAGNWSNMWAVGAINASGGQDASVLDMINPEDIESIEVIKGPAAATLYGADAAAGVIQIITKKGRAGQQALQWNVKTEYGQTDWAGDAVRNYTACTAERAAQPLSSKDPNSPPAYIGCQGLERGSVINYAGLSDNPHGLRSGAVRNYQLSVRGGGEGYSFYVAGDQSLEEGVFLNNALERTSGRANFSFYPGDKMDFSVNVGFNRSHTQFPSNDNGGTGLVISSAFWVPGYNYQEARKWSDKDLAERQGFAWNPPNISNEWDNRLAGERLTLGSTANYRPFVWLKNRLTVGMDINAREATQYAAPRSAYSTKGFLYVRRPQDNVYSVDYSGTIQNDLSVDVSSDLSFGTQYTKRQYKDTRSYGEGFASEFNRLVSQAAETRGSDSYLELASLGFFVQEQVGWRNRLFLTGAVRMDNSSVFGADIERIFYPKLSGSYIISEEPFFNVPGVNQLKLRAAYGEAGKAPGAFAAARQYAAVVGTQENGKSIAGIRLGAFGNPELEPERGSEYEVGFESSLLNDRAGVEFTYYNKTMRDAIMSVPVAPSSGFTGSQYQNLGEVNNRGMELSLTGTPVQTRPVTWNSRLSLYTNSNELVSFGYERSPLRLGFYGSPQRHEPGYALAGYWAKRYVMDENGDYARNGEGKLMVEKEESYIGPSAPTREVGFSNTITLFGNLDLYALVDYKGGHYQYNYKDMSRCSGSRCRVVAEAEATLDNPNSSEAAKKDAQMTLDLYTFSGGVGFWDRKINFIQKADFVKLRSLSVTYRVPEHLGNRFGTERLSVTVAGHNLALWAPHYDGPDPEVNFYGDDEFRRVDAWTAPMLQRVTASVNVSF